MQNRKQIFNYLATELGITQEGDVIRTPGITRTFDTAALADRLTTMSDYIFEAMVTQELAAQKQGMAQGQEITLKVMNEANAASNS